MEHRLIDRLEKWVVYVAIMSEYTKANLDFFKAENSDQDSEVEKAARDIMKLATNGNSQRTAVSFNMETVDFQKKLLEDLVNPKGRKNSKKDSAAPTYPYFPRNHWSSRILGFWGPFTEDFYQRALKNDSIIEDSFKWTADGKKKNQWFLIELLKIIQRAGDKHYWSSVPVSKVQLPIELLWWLNAVNEFLANDSETLSFGDWLSKADNSKMIDALFNNIQVNDYLHTEQLLKHYCYDKFGTISRKTSKANKALFFKLNKNQFTEFIASGKDKKANRTLYTEFLSKALEVNTKQKMDKNFHNAVFAAAKEITDRESLPYISHAYKRIDMASPKYGEIFINEADLVGNEILKNSVNFSMAELFVLMEGLHKPGLWIRSGKNMAWAIAGRFARSGQFVDFAKTVIDFVLSGTTIPPTPREWERVLATDSVVLGASLVSSLLVEYSGGTNYFQAKKGYAAKLTRKAFMDKLELVQSLERKTT